MRLALVLLLLLQRQPVLGATALQAQAVTAPDPPDSTSAAEASPPQSPFDLRAERLPTPSMGIDNQEPELHWTLASDVRGAVSLAYELQLGVAPLLAAAPSAAVSWNASEPMMWATGKVPHCHGVSAGTVCVPESHTIYAGTHPLASATTYMWRVRWWSNGTASTGPSPWSDPAIFVTGLFAPTDWRDADFLTCDPATKPKWRPAAPPKGSPEWPVKGAPQCRFLQSEFELTAPPARATAMIAAMGPHFR